MEGIATKRAKGRGEAGLIVSITTPRFLVALDFAAPKLPCPSDGPHRRPTLKKHVHIINSLMKKRKERDLIGGQGVRIN